MNRKLISVALAIGMLATAFVAIGVAAQDIETQLALKNSDDEIETLFFNYEDLHYELTFLVDSATEAASFTLTLRDFAGNGLDTENVNTPDDASFESLSNPGSEFPLGAYSDGVYKLEAKLDSTGKVMVVKEFTIISEKIEIEPNDTRFEYAPGETVTITITLDFDDDVNITIWPVNVTWAYRDVADYQVSIDWTIPTDIETGTHTIYVNESDTDPEVILRMGWINIEYFTFQLIPERQVWFWSDWGYYLPGETATAQWIAYSVPTMSYMTIDNLEFNMTYTHAITGDLTWYNTTHTASPFSVVIPELADINWDIDVDFKAYAGNYTHDGSFWIELGELTATMTLDPDPMMGSYMPGETARVEVDAGVVGWWETTPLPGADVDIVVKDDEGAVLDIDTSNASLVTNSVGWVSTFITLPSDTEEGDYWVVATISKLGYSLMISEWVYVQDMWTIQVLTDKDSYISGEDIEVTVMLLVNGAERTTIDYLEYQLEVIADPVGFVETANNLSFTITAPDDIDSDSVSVNVNVYLDDGELVLWAESADFEIWSLRLLLSVSQWEYEPGDTIEFEVEVLGNSAGFDIMYWIYDDLGVPVVIAEELEIDDDGMGSFELEVPEDLAPASYYVKVTADNGEGLVMMVEETVYLISDYKVTFWIKTSPDYQSGGYSPGQTLVCGFEVIPLRRNMPELTVLTVYIELHNQMGVTWAAGEIKQFTEMSGEISIKIPDNANTGILYSVDLWIDEISMWMPVATEQIYIYQDGSGWDKSLGGLSAANWMMVIFFLIIIIMLALMMMKSMGKGPLVPAEEKPPKPVKEEKKPSEKYEPKSTVNCPSCGAPIEVATSKRPIEVMCPKCGASQMVK